MDGLGFEDIILSLLLGEEESLASLDLERCKLFSLVLPLELFDTVSNGLSIEFGALILSDLVCFNSMLVTRSLDSSLYVTGTALKNG